MGCADLLNAVQCLGSGDLADGEQAGSRARLAAVPGGGTVLLLRSAVVKGDECEIE